MQGKSSQPDKQVNSNSALSTSTCLHVGLVYFLAEGSVSVYTGRRLVLLDMCINIKFSFHAETFQGKFALLSLYCSPRKWMAIAPSPASHKYTWLTTRVMAFRGCSLETPVWAFVCVINDASTHLESITLAH